MRSWLLWVRGLRGPNAQMVFGDATRPFIDDGIKVHVLSQHLLETDEEMTPLSGLAELHPAPLTVEPSP